MSQVLFNRRTGRPVTVSDKLARALAKGGRYLRRDMQAEAAPAGDPVGLSSEDVGEDLAQTAEQSAPTEQAESGAAAPSADDATTREPEVAAPPAQPEAAKPDSTKRTYRRRDQRAG